MEILMNVTETWILYIGIVVATILLIGVVLFFTCGLRSRRESKVERVLVDEKFILDLISGLGDESNVQEICIDNGRLKFKVKDLDLINSFISINSVILLSSSTSYSKQLDG